MDILITKYIGIKGTAILARHGYEELVNKYPEWLIDEASLFDNNIQCGYDNDTLKEVGISLSNGAVYAEEYDEFGVYEALFKMAQSLKCGLEVDIKAIPIKQETVEVCEFFGVNPYAMFSGYSAVIVSDDGVRMVEKLNEAGIMATIVGHTTPGNDKVLINEDERGFLQHIRKDQLKDILGRKVYYERTNLSST